MEWKSIANFMLRSVSLVPPLIDLKINTRFNATGFKFPRGKCDLISRFDVYNRCEGVEQVDCKARLEWNQHTIHPNPSSVCCLSCCGVHLPFSPTNRPSNSSTLFFLAIDLGMALGWWWGETGKLYMRSNPSPLLRDPVLRSANKFNLFGRSVFGGRPQLQFSSPHQAASSVGFSESSMNASEEVY